MQDGQLLHISYKLLVAHQQAIFSHGQMQLDFYNHCHLIKYCLGKESCHYRPFLEHKDHVQWQFAKCHEFEEQR